MTSSGDSGQVTGTKDKDYNILWYTQTCLDNALRLETYIQDAEQAGDSELAEFFRKAQADSKKGAELGKADAEVPARQLIQIGTQALLTPRV